MTLDKTAWVINGPTTSASLGRRALYAASRQAGIVQQGDLAVKALAVPGIGITVAPGVGVVLNGYQNTQPGGPNEAYIVSNPGLHTVPAGSMPASSPSATYWLVCAVVGDEDFPSAGHPFMTSDGVPDGTEDDFAYVRIVLIQCNAGDTAPSGNFPALPLARLEIPANTTTIQQSYIKDLRNLANPRQSQAAFVSAAGTWTSTHTSPIPSASDYADWVTAAYAPTVAVPSWAKRAIVIANLNGVRLQDPTVNVVGNVRTQLGSVSGPSTSFDLPTGGGVQRLNLMTAGEYDVSSIAGTSVLVRVEGFQNKPTTPTADQKLTLQQGSQVVFDVRFFEQ